jgi:hypothetical protein
MCTYVGFCVISAPLSHVLSSFRLPCLSTLMPESDHECSPRWDGSVNTLLTVSAAKVQGLVGAREPFEHFVQVSGAASLDRALARLNARLAA